MFNKIIDFKKSTEAHSGVTTLYTGQQLSNIEHIGPADYEGYIHISREEITVPHIDLFTNGLRDLFGDNPFYYNKVVLSGTTKDIKVPFYGSNTDSIKQYYLEHKTRDELQYLIYHNKEAVEVEEGEEPINNDRFDLIIPGLIYSSDTGVVLGYLHSYVIDNNSEVELELPYGSNYDSYTITGEGISCIRVDNSVTIIVSALITSTSVTVTISDGTNSTDFNIYKSSNGETQELRVKNANEFGDYLIASKEVNNILDMERIFSTSKVIAPNKYYCERFMSLNLFSFAETQPDVTPNIYRVPAALVPTDNERVFMTDIIGMSTVLIKGENQ